MKPTTIKTLAETIDELRYEIADLRRDLDEIEIDDLRADVDGIRNDCHDVRGELASLDTRRSMPTDTSIENALADLERRLWRLELRPVRCACTACAHTPIVGVA